MGKDTLWKPSSELKLKPGGKRVIVYLTFTRDFEVTCNQGSIVAVDVNENNVTWLFSRMGSCVKYIE